MKKRLIAAACAFIVLLAVITALLCAVIEKSDSGDYGRFAVAANEIEHIENKTVATIKNFKTNFFIYSPPLYLLYHYNYHEITIIVIPEFI